jgi:RNA polymerase sigma-70 factor, ECF subfamily
MDARTLRHGADRRGGTPLSAGFRRGVRLAGEGPDPIVIRAIAAAKAGDRDALRYLYARYADHVYGYVLSIVRDEHEAEDVTQQVFARLPRSLSRYEPRGVPFAAWLRCVARNQALDHLRASRAVPCVEVRSADVPSDDTGRERSRALRDALERLPSEQRQVVVLRHVVGLSPGEIAVRMGKSEGAVHALHHRARGTLRAMLAELSATPAVLA